MLILLESIAACFVLVMVCVIGIANGPAGLVVFYEQDVKDRVVELKLTTKEKIKKTSMIAMTALFIPMLIFTPFLVYYVNGARGFWEFFWQIAVIFWIMGIFDRVFIDWYWVGNTKAWLIPNTEDLMPYIPKKAALKKWMVTIVGYPILALILAFIMNLIV